MPSRPPVHRPPSLAPRVHAPATDTRPSRQARGYTEDWYTRTRPHILRRDKHLCQECLRAGTLTPVAGLRAHVDHIVAKDDGGTDDETNLETLCSSCHGRKTRREHARKGG